MADNLPVSFPIPGESAIASYDYTDIAEGTGMVVFYAFSSYEGGAADYHLSTSAIPSHNQFTQATIGDHIYQPICDLDFDTSPFNLPKTIKGTAWVVVPCGYAEGVSSSGDIKFTAYIRKWTGSVESEIASAASEDPIVLDTAGDDHKSKYAVVKITVPQTHFKIGEMLRLTIVAMGVSNDGDNNGYYCIGHDPANRNSQYATGTIAPFEDNYGGSVLKVYIPFKIDL